MTIIPVIDGHNDTLTRIFPSGDETSRSMLKRDAQGHVDLRRAQEGGLAGGFFAIFISGDDKGAFQSITANDGTSLKAYCSAPIGRDLARSRTESVLRRTAGMLNEADGKIRLVRTVADIQGCLKDGVLALVLHYEGAEMLREDLSDLDRDYQRGLRSLGPVWSRDNAFAHGVPFGFPGTPDIGPGLTDAGRHLVRRCNDLGILLDVSHLNYQGFMDLAQCTTAPVVATHCGAHAICPSTRNLLDDQLDVIKQTNGLVGVNFFVGYLRPDGKDNPDTPLSVIADHVDYMVNRMGIDHVAFGSDFDGATMPEPLGDCSGLPRLLEVLRTCGWSQDDLRAMAHGNWLRVLGDTWASPETPTPKRP